MSRSSSKASSIDHAPGTTKPPKPRRPTNYAERTSSISLKRASLPAGPQQPKYLNLNQSNFSPSSKEVSAGKEQGGGSLITPTKGRTGTVIRSPGLEAASTPKPVTVAFTPFVEKVTENPQPAKSESDVSPRADSAGIEAVSTDDVEALTVPYFALPPPTRPAVEVARTPATRMYWHQPPTHGMMVQAPFRRSHSIAQVGSSIFLFGGSDGGSSKATDTVFIFDTGNAQVTSLGDLAIDCRYLLLANPESQRDYSSPVKSTYNNRPPPQNIPLWRRNRKRKLLQSRLFVLRIDIPLGLSYPLISPLRSA